MGEPYSFIVTKLAGVERIERKTMIDFWESFAALCDKAEISDFFWKRAAVHYLRYGVMTTDRIFW
jgi:hypothetical protein